VNAPDARDYDPGPVFDGRALLARLRAAEADNHRLRDDLDDLRAQLAIARRWRRMRGLRRWFA
jgi:hypothetical protein